MFTFDEKFPYALIWDDGSIANQKPNLLTVWLSPKMYFAAHQLKLLCKTFEYLITIYLLLPYGSG